jgi:hypothetical protein
MSETTVRETGTGRKPAPRPAPGRRVPPGRVPSRQDGHGGGPGDQRGGARAGTRPAGRAAGVRAPGAPRAASRVPFVFLLCGLLIGALVCALVINTTLAAGEFRITSLQQSDSTLAKEEQQLQEQVAAAQSAPVIEQRAYQLGMRPGELRFLNLRTGKTQSVAGSGAAQPPGYVP